jgi:predicted negative regulator of RcsB-dependent stress response
MAKKKPTRKELLKSPDEFMTFSNRAAEFLAGHTTGLKYIGLALIVVAVAYLAVHFYFRSVHKKGQDAYNEAYYTLIEDFKPDLDPEKLRTSEELFQKLLDEYGRSKAARLALVQLAHAKYIRKDYDEAIALYRRFLDQVSGETEYESLTNLALSGCYESKGDLKAAMESLNPILERPDNPFKEAAMMSLARLYRLDNKFAKEKEILEQFVEKHQDSPFLPIVKSRL